MENNACTITVSRLKMIPKIFHRIWLGESPVPTQYEHYWDRWKLFHPDWEFKDWRNQDIDNLALSPIINRAKVNAVKADISRYEILHLYGGVYLDCDMDCRQPIDSLVNDTDNFIICNQISNLRCLCSMGFFAAIPSHPILSHAIRELKDTDIELINNSSPADVTGPYFFRRVINNRKVKILDSQAFYPYFHNRGDWYQRDMTQVYGVHNWAGSWLSSEILLGLAKNQYRYGDTSSCIDTCRQCKDVWKLEEKSEAKLKDFFHQANIRILEIFCTLRRILYLPLFFLLFGIGSTFIFIPHIYFLSNQNLRIIQRAVRKLYRLSVKAYRRLLKEIFSEPANMQYNHLLDYVFAKRDNSQPLKVLEIGAMDGKSFDPLYSYLKSGQNLEVVLIEPLPEMISALKKTYEGYEERGSRFHFKDVAIVEEEKVVHIHTIPKHIIDSEGLPEWVKGISTLAPDKNVLSDSGAYLSSNGQSLNQFSTKIEVKGMPLKKALTQCGFDDFDILQIDVEGCDYDVLTQALAIHHPKVICFEWVNLDASERKALVKELTLKGYFPFLSLNSCDCIACTYDLLIGLSLETFRNHSVMLFPPSNV